MSTLTERVAVRCGANPGTPWTSAGGGITAWRMGVPQPSAGELAAVTPAEVTAAYASNPIDPAVAVMAVAGTVPVYVPFVRTLGAAGRSGSFDVTGLTGLTAGGLVLVAQTAAAIASRGDASDEPEMDAIAATGYVLNATTIRVHWRATGVVVGDYSFVYCILP